jgi:hypothetical protein
MVNNLLFSGNSVGDVLRAQHERLRDFVLALDANAVLTTPVEDMLDRVVAQFEIHCPVLRREDQYSPGATDARIDVTGDFGRATFGPGPHYVSGTRYSLHIPFDGEPDVFFLRPNPFSLNPPTATVSGQEIILTVQAPADSLDPPALRRQLDEQLTQIETHLDRARIEVDQYNAGLREAARGLLERRRQKVLADRALEEHLAVPVTRRDDYSPILAVDVPKKRRPMPAAVVETAAPFHPEPAITRSDFDAIIDVIASFGFAAERFPETFRPMREEVLRELVLVILNNQFGPAVGELFSRSGKTDITIVQAKGPVFVAECKIWKGDAAFREAIDQLLGYLVWRDSKAALVLFVRNKDVTGVILKAEALVRKHDRYKREGPRSGDRPVFVLHHEGDVNREIEIALIVVPIPN